MARNRNIKFAYTASKCYTQTPYVWGSTSTYQVMHNGSNFSEAKKSIEHYGAIKFKNFITDHQVDHYRNVLINHTEMDDKDYLPVSRGEYLPAVGSNTGGAPLMNNSEFLTLITHSRIRQLLQGLYGGDKQFTEIGNTLSVHYTARPLHRDLYPYPLDTDHSYNLFSGSMHYIRIIFYLNYSGRPAEIMEVLPFSHRADKYHLGCKKAKTTPLDLFNENHMQTDPKQGIPPTIASEDIQKQTLSLTFEPGDILAFDTRLFHSGAILSAPKYSFITTFAVEDSYTIPYLLKSIDSRNAEAKLEYYTRLNAVNFCSDSLLSTIQQHIDNLKIISN